MVPRCFLALVVFPALIHPAVAVISCTETAGPAQARRYVEQCRMVAPAGHAICRTENSCTLIQDEIRRGCALSGKAEPAFCMLYRPAG